MCSVRRSSREARNSSRGWASFRVSMAMMQLLLLEIQLEELNGIAAQHLIPLSFGDVRIDFVDQLGRARELALHVREVGGEHQAVHADVVPNLDRYPLALDAPLDVALDVVAGRLLQGLQPQVSLAPEDVALVLQVAVLEPERQPADTRLGHEDPQLGKTVEQA